jgi:hypothetical protein
MIAAAAALAFAGQAASAATSVSTRTNGIVSYDASTATMTATFTLGTARLLNSGPPINETNVNAVGTLRIGFAAPLERTDEVQQIQFTGSGLRYVASFVRGTATSFEYIVNTLPDGNGVSTNLLTMRSTSGFIAPYQSLDQLTYYYDFNGNTKESDLTLYNPYNSILNFNFLTRVPPCNCSDHASPGTWVTTSSDIGDYTLSIYKQRTQFILNEFGSGHDLWSVTTPGVSAVSSFTVGGTAELRAAVPEPASWAMMIVGFGLVGTSLRHRNRLAHI